MILRQRGCKIRGKWTPLDTGLEGNERAGTLAKLGINEPLCDWGRSTLTWLRTRPRRHCTDKWIALCNLQTTPKTKPFEPTSTVSRRTARAIARLRPELTMIYPSPLMIPVPCGCGAATISSRHILLDCTDKPATSAWTTSSDNIKDKRRGSASLPKSSTQKNWSSSWHLPAASRYDISFQATKTHARRDMNYERTFKDQ